MKTVSAAEFGKSLLEYLGRAENEPIEVTSDGKIAGYFISADWYNQVQKIVAASRQALHPSGLPSHLQTAVCEAQMDPRHDQLNTLLDSSK